MRARKRHRMILVELADILGPRDCLAITQTYTQKPLGVLQDEVEKVQFFQYRLEW